MVLLYKDNIIMEDIDIYNTGIKILLKRPMFKNMTKDQYNSIEIIDRKLYNTDYRYNIISKRFIVIDMEYELLYNLYRNSDTINTKYTFYNYLFTHPMFTIKDIDEYIKYRDILDNISELDRKYDSIVGTI